MTEPAVAEVIVVIDGIADGTKEVLSGYASERVQVIARAENWGASRTRNQGLERVSTEFVMFIDADDFVEGSLIRGLVQQLQLSASDVGFGPMEILYERENRRAQRFVPDFSSAPDIFRKWHLEGLYVNPASVMWRTEFIRRIGGWDPEITRNDDGELVMRATLLGAKIAISDEGSGIYVKHSSGTLNNRIDNMESMLSANEKLLAVDSPVIGREFQQEICAGHFFNIAWHCFLNFRDELGSVALTRSRQLGGRVRGSLIHRMSFGLLGVRRTCHVVRWLKRSAADQGRGDPGRTDRVPAD